MRTKDRVDGTRSVSAEDTGRARNRLLLAAGAFALVTAGAHAFAGQAHLSRVLDADIGAVDRAVMFAVWHMVTLILVAAGLGLATLGLSGRRAIVRPAALAIALLFALFGVVFVLASILFGEPALQWIAMTIVAVLSAAGWWRAK